MFNIDILTHFEESDHVAGIKIFKLKEEEREVFFKKIAKPYRLLYISDEDLELYTDILGTTRNEEILEKVPDKPHLQSGEFGEILTYYLIAEKYAPDSELRPPKWRWKESKNNPAHFTDVVIFHQISPDTADEKDYIISIESKAKASKPGSKDSSLQDAINDTHKDYTSRLAESLFHIKTKYKSDKDFTTIQKLERFLDAVKFPTFLKHFKAIATVDDSFGDEHISNIKSMPSDIKDSFEVILIRIVDLKIAYEQTYIKILGT